MIGFSLLKMTFLQGTFWDDVGSQHGRSMLPHQTQGHGVGLGCVALFSKEPSEVKTRRQN